MGRLAALRSKTSSITPIGIDVGRDAVRAAQLHRSGDRYTVTRLGSWKIPPGMNLQKDERLVGRLGVWLQQMGFRRRNCVMGLSSPDVEIHAMELPKSINPAQSKQAARWEVERLMSFEEGTATIDYWPIPESGQMTSTAIGVAAAPNAFDTLRPICEQAHLTCTGLDATSCALARFGALYRGPVSNADVWGVLDLGARQTRLTICVAQVPILVRSFNNGGQKWTDALGAALSVSVGAAERHKRDHGIGSAQKRRSDDAFSGGGPVAEMIFNVLRDDLDAVVAELERSYKYAIRCFSDRPCGPLLLVGGGAGMKNLSSLLTEKLGIEVVVPTPEDAGEHCQLDFTPVAGNLREPLAEYASAIGLSIDQGASR